MQLSIFQQNRIDPLTYLKANNPALGSSYLLYILRIQDLATKYRITETIDRGWCRHAVCPDLGSDFPLRNLLVQRLRFASHPLPKCTIYYQTGSAILRSCINKRNLKNNSVCYVQLSQFESNASCYINHLHVRMAE